MPEPDRVVAYLVRSDATNRTPAHSLTNLRQRVSSWCRAENLQLVELFRDDNVQHDDHLADRPGLQKALLALAESRASKLLVESLEQLHHDVVQQELVIAELNKMGLRLITMSPADHDALLERPRSRERRDARRTVRVTMKFDTTIASARRLEGRRRKAAAGGHAAGAPPFGTRAQDGELVPVDDAQDTIARARELRSRGWSLRRVCAELDAENRPAPRGGAWSPSTLQRVLGRPT